MRMKKTTIYLFLITLLTIWSCKPVEEGYGLDDPEQYSSVYIAAAFNGMQSMTVSATELVNIEVYANYSGVITLSDDIQVFMEEDLERVDAYNTTNGTSFKSMPTTHFSIETNCSTILAGTTTAISPAVIKLNTGAFADGDTYLLPISITSISNPAIKVSDKLGTLYLGVKCKAGSFIITNNPLTDYIVSDTEEW